MLVMRRRILFVQAEDGIRDWSVTGVQTCALPISAARLRRLVAQHRAEILALARKYGATSIRLFGSVARGDARERSEERRVGRECRSRRCRARAQNKHETRRGLHRL